LNEAEGVARGSFFLENDGVRLRDCNRSGWLDRLYHGQSLRILCLEEIFKSVAETGVHAAENSDSDNVFFESSVLFQILEEMSQKDILFTSCQKVSVQIVNEVIPVSEVKFWFTEFVEFKCC
jgi:hypothetical protein